MNKIVWQNIFVFLFLILFPFGQIFRINIIHPLDVVVGLAALYSIINNLEVPKIFQDFKNTLYVFTFSFVLSIFIFWRKDLLIGLLYLLRFTSYFYFLVYIWNFLKSKANQMLLTNALIGVSVFSALFGWIQYFWLPSLKPFFTFGWDEHLFRLVGTFLDPTFLGLIIVFGLLITMHRCMIILKKKYLIIIMFLLTSLAFTYSRGSYLAFFAGTLMLSIYHKKIKQFLLLALALLLLIVLLPTSKNHSIEFFRAFSAISRVNNYSETITIFKTSPVFGVGFDNMCIARQKFIGIESFASHACSGSDSSLLLILATTGIAGLFSFIYLIIKVWKNSNILSKSIFVSVIVHSLFSNSLFYPWIMGYLVIVFALSLRSKIEN